MPHAVSAVLHDLRDALRMTRRRPVPFAVAVLTIALVTAAAGAVTAVASAAFVRPLPFPAPERLVRLYTMPPGSTSFNQANPFHPLEFIRFRERPGPLESVEGIWIRDRAIGGDGEPESISVGAVSAGFLSVLGAPPVLGRTFRPDDDANAAKVTVLGHGFWVRRFGGDRAVLGRQLVIDREPHEIIGVMPPGFEPGFAASELWTPLGFRDGRMVLPGATFIQTIGRVREGIGAAQAAAEIEAMFAAVRDESPGILRGWAIGVLPLREAQFGQQRPAIVMLLTAVVLLGLIAAANLAHLSLADVLRRRGEIALRLALGAQRGDLLRSHLAERLLVTAAGGALGLAMAGIVLPPLAALDPTGLSRVLEIRLDWRVALAAIGFAGVVAMGASVVPVWRTAGRGFAASMSATGRGGSSSPPQLRVRALLVALEMGLAVLLLATGAQLLDAFRRTAATSPGFDPGGVVGAQIRLSETAYATEEARTAFVSRVLERVRAIPGVTHAGTTMNRFVPGFAYVTLVHIPGQPTPTGEPHTVQFRRVSPGYFETLRIPIVRGRTFDARDGATGQRVAVVSESFATQFWPGTDPVGRTVQRGTTGVVTVIGVVGDVSDVGFGQAPEATVYTSYGQGNTIAAPVGLVVRSERTLPDLATALKAAIREIDPAQPVSRIAPLDEFLHGSLGPQRFRSTLLLIVASIGLLLACVGIYGVTGRTVLERRREAGVRLALGASARSVWWTVSSRALAGVTSGAIAGVLLAIAAHYVLIGFLPELAGGSAIGASLPAVTVLAVTGVLSAAIPARRSARTSPLVALRGE